MPETRLNVNPADAPPWARRPPRDERDPDPQPAGWFGDPIPDPWHDPTVDPGPLPF